MTIFKLTIRKKLLLGFMGIIFMFVLVSLFSVLNFIKNNEIVDEIDKEILQDTLKFSELQKDIIHIQQWLTDISATRGEEGFDSGFEAAHTYFENAIGSIDILREKYKERNETELMSLIETVKKELIDYYYFGVKMAEAYIEGGHILGNPLMKRFNPYAEKLHNDIEVIVKEHKTNLAVNVSLIKKNFDQLSSVLIICLILTITIGIIFAVIFSNSLSKTIQIAVSTIQDIIENKDLTKEIKVTTEDELILLAGSMNSFLESIKDVMLTLQSISLRSRVHGFHLSTIASETSVNVDKILTSLSTDKDIIEKLNEDIKTSAFDVEQIVRSLSNIANLVEKQSTAVSESSSSIEQIGEQLRNITRIVNDKRELSNNLSETAKDGLEKMEKSVESVNNISTSADRMLEMIEIINNVAEQTDLLSMNAAIEAAQAGTAGKGFAVVADEIKKLSEQTKLNADQINQSLHMTVDDINRANEINKVSGDAFHSLVIGINEIAEAMEETATGMNELLVGSDDIVKSLNSLVMITEDIKTGSKNINESAHSININISRVSKVSTQTLESIEEISGGTAQITGLMENLTNISKENEDNILLLDGEINRYKTEVDDKK